MSGQNRLPLGGRIDRRNTLSFTFNGSRYKGFRGDTVASALLGNGVDIVGRSFKYSRPRGIVAAGTEEPNALLQLGVGGTTTPNVLATQAEIYDGLVARSTNGWPSVNFDLTALAGWLAPLLPPGFYYKTFMWPSRWWPIYERFIRKMAGFGRVPAQRDTDSYDKLHHHCEVLVIGGGPAGLAAALAVARSGARIVVVDEQAELGGCLLSLKLKVGDQPSSDWLLATVAELQSLGNVTLLTRTTAFGYYDHNFVAAMERCGDHVKPTHDSSSTRQRLHRIRAKKVVLATGAIERLPVFANNDRPGVMLASAVETYVNRYAVAPGRRMVLFCSHDAAYRLALCWLDAGRDVVAVVDPRSAVSGDLPEAVRERGVEVIEGHAVVDTIGRGRVKAALVAPIARGWNRLAGPVRRRLDCDLIAASGGWSPTVHLSCHTGGKPVWSEEKQAFLPAEREDCLTAGGINAVDSVRGALEQGYAAGLGATGHDDGAVPGWQTDEPQAASGTALFLVPHPRRLSRAPKQFVDFQTDVTASAIALAAREGYESVEHAKRYTALGFGTDQGKLGNINGVAVLAHVLGKKMADTGTTMFRPAYTPISFGALAGRDIGELLDPARQTAMHRWHTDQGAQWENVGQWKRPWYYPLDGEDLHAAVARECHAVRTAAGILDTSTLGKIDIQGSDAAEFLDRMYSNLISTLAVGKCRYAMMLKDDGMIFDDGVIARLADNHFVATTTTSGAAAVMRWMELWLQTEWPDLNVYLTSVTDHWATMALSGPYSRSILTTLCQDVSLADDDFGFMEWRAGTVAGIPARIFRVSFTGELSFEINVPANFGQHVWQACIEAGRPFGIAPYGTEAMHVLRAEKGFVIVGQDTDGSVTPHDMGMSWIVSKKKAGDFVGKRSLERADTMRADRKHWVGLLTHDQAATLPEGGQLVDDPDQPLPMTMLGHVTSSYYSPTLNRSIALGFVRGGRERLGETVHCPLNDGRVIAATISKTVFFDPDGERQHV